MGEHRKLGEDQYTVSRKVKRTKTRHMFLRSLQQPSTLAMKLTLAPIFPLFFAVSAFGNPVTADNAIDELDPRQLNCDIARKIYLLYPSTSPRTDLSLLYRMPANDLYPNCRHHSAVWGGFAKP